MANNAKKEKTAIERAKLAEAEKHHKNLIKDANRNAKIVKIAPNDSFIILKNVNKIYDNHVQAVFNFNLEIKEKEFIVFVGPSGCGKSTTLRMIAGLEDITYGDLFIDGKYCNITPPKDRNLAMVFQNYALYPHMNVYSNMAFGIKIRKVKTYQYEPDPVYDGLIAQRKTISDTLAKLKSDDPNSASLNSQLADLDAKIAEQDKLRKPVVFIDKAMIKYLNKEIKKCNKAISELSSRKSISDLAEVDENKKNIEVINNTINKLTAELEKYKTTPVPKYTYKHLPKEEIDSRVHNAARILNLEQYLDRKPSAMSGGQRQRVALGRAIVRNAKVLLMDEPLSNLDAKLRVQMRSEIAELHKRIGSTTIYVTHDQTEAMTMADRIVVMKDGHIQQIGTPNEIYDHPSNTFVAGFIGSPAMNIFKGQIKGDQVMLPDNFNIKLSKAQHETFVNFSKKEIDNLKKKIAKINNLLNEQESSSNRVSEDNKALFTQRLKQYEESLARFTKYENGEIIPIEFGIRAEDIISGPDMMKYKNLSPVYHANVTVAEFMGHEYFIHYNFGDEKIVAKIPIADTLIKSGDIVDVKLNMDKIHIFEFGSKNTIL